MKSVKKFEIGSKLYESLPIGHSGVGEIEYEITDRYVKEKAKEVWYDVLVTITSYVISSIIEKPNPNKKWWDLFTSKYISEPIWVSKITTHIDEMSHIQIVGRFTVVEPN